MSSDGNGWIIFWTFLCLSGIAVVVAVFMQWLNWRDTAAVRDARIRREAEGDAARAQYRTARALEQADIQRRIDEARQRQAETADEPHDETQPRPFVQPKPAARQVTIGGRSLVTSPEWSAATPCHYTGGTYAGTYYEPAYYSSPFWDTSPNTPGE